MALDIFAFDFSLNSIPPRLASQHVDNLILNAARILNYQSHVSRSRLAVGSHSVDLKVGIRK